MKKIIIELFKNKLSYNLRIEGEFPYEGYVLFLKYCEYDLKTFIEKGRKLEIEEIFKLVY